MAGVHFFCENCGASVKPHDRICKKCGSFFEKVRCPVCQTQGDVEDFKSGCPVCGFQGDIGSPVPKSGDDGIVEVDMPGNFQPRATAKSSQHTQANIPLIVAVTVFGLVFFALALIYVRIR